MKIYTSKTEYLEAEIKRLHEVNQELLEALKNEKALNDAVGVVVDATNVAIAKAEGGAA